MFPYVLPILVALSMSGAGCDFLQYGIGPHPRNPRYAFGFFNATDEDLHRVHLEWKGRDRPYVISAGILVKNGEAENFKMPDPIPPAITVHWRDANGADHDQGVLVASQIKEIGTFSGTIWVKISEKGVTVVPLTDEEMHDRGRPPAEWRLHSKRG